MTTAIGYGFIGVGALWAMWVLFWGGMTESRATWRDIPFDFVWGLAGLLIGIALVWR